MVKKIIDYGNDSVLRNTNLSCPVQIFPKSIHMDPLAELPRGVKSIELNFLCRVSWEYIGIFGNV
ncbi:hypothetical protein P4534_23935 [Peribacillus butanolivorans]|uniref:hypothetical protein n=1 Tax=Peribacillus butanolivorans TaxID=421767 RepID=UPI002E1F86C3|nr:hypothetical protein [Peribacillus butanolivorans]